MLDTRQSWDDLVRRHAPDRATEQAILENKLYQNFAGRFVQSHDYIAMERLYEIHASGTYDLVIVDTPPTRNAVDFLDAPERRAEFFTSRFLRLLIAPYRSRLVSMASKPFYQVADRILGTQFLQDIAEFFILFQSMYDGFVQRARAVSALLRDKRSTFVVVSTLEAAPLDEAEFFLEQLAQRKLHLGAIVLNKVLPAYFSDPESYRVAERIPGEAKRIAAAVALPGEDEADVARVLDEVADSYLRFSVVAQREAEQRAELAASPEVVAAVPYFETDITDLRGLLQLGEKIW
jgi:anion-transporting  ArsA/GET3 family ATPase